MTGEEDEVFEALISLFPNDKTGSTPALTDYLVAYGEARADVFNRFVTRFPDDVARAEFLISAAMQTQKSGTPELSNALLIAAEAKIQGIGKNAELERARLLNKLGHEHYRFVRYAMAEPLYDEALLIRRRVLGADHPYTATGLNNLAGLYHDQGRYQDAEPMYHDALSIFRRVLGADDPNTATSLNNLAQLYRVQERYAEAAPMYKEAVEIMRRVLGAEHPKTKTVRGNYKKLLAEMEE